jgi:glycosyltransferase involved in cell wall biosynthesis
MMTFYKKIAIIGPYPPPYGGISVHIQRVLEHAKAKNVSVDFFNETSGSICQQRYLKFYGKWNKLFALLKLLIYPYRLIHHHSPDSIMRLILMSYGMLGKRVYLHIHGASLKDALAKGDFMSYLLAKMMKHVHVLADNPEIAEIARKYHAKSVAMIDAFIPPVYEEKIFRDFQEKLTLQRADYDLIVSMIGWFTVYNHQDLYGFDLLAEAVGILKQKYKIVIVVSVNGIVAQEVYDSFIEKLNHDDLKRNFVLLDEEMPEIWPIYLISDVFVRPTNTDGNALSIKEALWVGTPALASDCVERPPQTIMFKNRDAIDLAQKIEEQIVNCHSLKSVEEKIRIFQTKEFHNLLFEEIYHDTVG